MHEFDDRLRDLPTDGAGADDLNERLRQLPAVDEVIAALRESKHPTTIVVGAARRAIDAFRERVRAGAPPPSLDDVVTEARSLLEEHVRSLLRPVINATGVLIHTNLGRVPLGREQLDVVTRVAGSYSNLEYDLASGSRGSRYQHARRLLAEATGAESALVVNNNAAALVVTLAALAARREVIVSRGELIEIGGEFRIPDICEAAGVTLVEVGTTNRTHVADYGRAITPESAAILKVHPSNYRVVGFTASVDGHELGRLARGRGVPLIYDVGSGLVGAPDNIGWTHGEPAVDHALSDGADLVTFSGDKLLGGPQAGVIAGRAELVDKIAAHPLMRAVRPDKMTLAALEATLSIYLAGRAHSLPLWQMATTSLDELERRARAIALAVSEELAYQGVKAEAVPTSSVTGGGSLPGTEIPSYAVGVTHPERSTAQLERTLRGGRIPVIARIEDDVLLLDLRTVPPSADAQLQALLLAALS